MIKRSPFRYLSCELDLLDTHRLRDPLFGIYHAPRRARYNVSGLKGRGPVFILDYCLSRGSGCPDYCLFAQKDGVSVEENTGWVIRYSKNAVFEATHPTTESCMARTNSLFKERVSARAVSAPCVTKVFIYFNFSCEYHISLIPVVTNRPIGFCITYSQFM